MTAPTREEYEKELKQRQERHLAQVNTQKIAWRPCMHDECTQCHGTGIKVTGGACIHGIACPCPKCSSYC